MTSIEDAVIAKVRIKGEIFELLVDCDKALEFKEGKCNIGDAIVTTGIFKDVKQGEKASENEMKKIFGTDDFNEVASVIIKTGDIQLTAEHRNRLRDQKKKQVIDMIHRNAVNPQTGLPHPPQRIESALEESQIKIDEFKNVEDQIQDIIEQLRPILPLNFEKRILEVNIPVQYASKAFSILKTLGEIKKDIWNGDGSLTAQVEIPAGMQEQFEDEVNKLTHGDIDMKIIKKE